MGTLYFWGHSIQEMGGNVVIGRSIYGVVVIIILPIVTGNYYPLQAITLHAFCLRITNYSSCFEVELPITITAFENYIIM